MCNSSKDVKTLLEWRAIFILLFVFFGFFFFLQEPEHVSNSAMYFKSVGLKASLPTVIARAKSLLIRTGYWNSWNSHY